MADAQHTPEQAIRRLAAVVQWTDDAIVTKDLESIITSWNRGAERMFGYTADEVIGQSVRMIIPPELLQEEDMVLARIRAGEVVDHFETRRRRKDGTDLIVSLTVSPLVDESGVIVGASKIARDVTERVRLLDEAREADRLKDEFLAVLSHELRTPLNAILGYARLLRSGVISGEKAQRGIETVERNATALTQIVEDVLDISRIVSGKMRLDVQPVELQLVLHNAVSTVFPAADAKQVRVHLMADPAIGPVSGDPNRLQQVVWNLLSNAVKFTPKGGRVQVRLERVNSHVEIVISDTGIGIRPDFLPHVFDRFRQADASTIRKTSGLGLGLSIVRHVVEMHGGSVTASSEGEGKGTTFRVKLPLMAVQPANISERRQHPRSEISPPPTSLDDLTGVRVLALDDEADARALLRTVLESAGATVLTAGSSSEALAAIEEFKPDAVLADLGMPDTDGYAFIAEVRAASSPHVRDVPAAALTAFARAEDRTRALQSGFEMHLAKPVDPAELVASVATLVRRRRV